MFWKHGKMGSEPKEIRGVRQRGYPPGNSQLGAGVVVRNYMLLRTKNKRSIEVNKMGT